MKTVFAFMAAIGFAVVVWLYRNPVVLLAATVFGWWFGGSLGMLPAVALFVVGSAVLRYLFVTAKGWSFAMDLKWNLLRPMAETLVVLMEPVDAFGFLKDLRLKAETEISKQKRAIRLEWCARWEKHRAGLMSRDVFGSWRQRGRWS
jgi:hypothetical protein